MVAWHLGILLLFPSFNRLLKNAVGLSSVFGKTRN